MSAPIHNHRSEVDRSSMSNSAPKIASHQPPLHQDRLEMHDAGICSWIGTAFWYVIDCINVVYDWVVLQGWNLLAKIGLVNPPEAAHVERTFADRAADVKATFAAKTSFEQVEILRKVSCDWTDAQGERQGLLSDLKDLLGEELRDALIAHRNALSPGNEVTSENLAEYLVQMQPQDFNLFLKGDEHVDGFAQFKIETLALGWYLDDSLRGDGKPPAQEAHFMALRWIAEAEPHDVFEQHIDAPWMNAHFTTAKGKLTVSDKGVLLSAYNIHRAEDFHGAVNAYIALHPGSARALLLRLPGFEVARQAEDQYLTQFYGHLDPAPKAKLQEEFYAQNQTCKEQWNQGFNEWLRDVARDDGPFGQILTIATSQVPSVVKRTCNEMLEDNNGNRAALFVNNPDWVQRFLDVFINAQVTALFAAQKEGEVAQAITERIDLEWQQQLVAQDEESYAGVQHEEGAYKASIRDRVAPQVEAGFRDELKRNLVQAGWNIGNIHLLQLIDQHGEQDEIKAAIRASMPR